MKLVVLELALFGAVAACKFEKVPVGIYHGLDVDGSSLGAVGVLSETHIKVNILDTADANPFYLGSPLIEYSFDKLLCTLEVEPVKIESSRFKRIRFYGEGEPYEEFSIRGSMTFVNKLTLTDDETLICHISGVALKREDVVDWRAEYGQLQHLRLTDGDVEKIESLMNEMTEE
jgi:hypothetical protein